MNRRAKRTYRILPVAERGDGRRPPRCGSPEERALAIYKRPRRVLIAEAAYYRALRRGFAAGDPLEDWFEAEAEIDALLDAQREAAGPGSGEVSPSTARNQR